MEDQPSGFVNCFSPSLRSWHEDTDFCAMVRVICVIDVVCLRSNFHVVRAGDVNAFFWGPHGVIFSLGRWRACQARSSLQNPCWGIQDCGWPGKKSPFLTSCTAFFLCPSPCSDSAQQIIVIQALMKSIIALVRYLMIFFSSLVSVGHSLFLLSLTHYRNKHVFGLWMFAAVVALLCQFKKRKELCDLDAIKVGLYFFDPWGLEKFSVLKNEENSEFVCNYCTRWLV